MVIPYSDAKITLLIHMRRRDLFTFGKMWGIDVFVYQKVFPHVRLPRSAVFEYKI
jgi:hypothetical protein